MSRELGEFVKYMTESGKQRFIDDILNDSTLESEQDRIGAALKIGFVAAGGSDIVVVHADESQDVVEEFAADPLLFISEDDEVLFEVDVLEEEAINGN